jgi:hypothetical protein
MLFLLLQMHITVEAMSSAIQLSEYGVVSDNKTTADTHGDQVNVQACADKSFNITASLNMCQETTSADKGASIDEHEMWTADVIQRVASIGFIMVLTLIGNIVIIIVLTCSRYRERNSRGICAFA